MNLPPPPTPVPVPTNTWELPSNSNQRMLENIDDGFRKEVCSDGSCRCDPAEEEEKDMAIVSHRYDVELLQNCDLPPPVKFFAGEKGASWKRAMSMQPSPPMRKIGGGEEGEFGGGLINDRLGLLKALHLSQTRAREAERKASTMGMEKDNLTAMFFKDSSRLFSHRQLLKLLEMEILRLKAQLATSDSRATKKQPGGENRDDGDGGAAWYIALALCLGLAGVGFALSCRCLF